MESLHQIADSITDQRLPAQTTPGAALTTSVASNQQALAPTGQSTPAAAAQASAQTSQDATTPHGMSLIDAVASISTGRSMITDMVFGADNQVSQIRVIDPATHRVIASTPPDTIARFEREVAAYQQVARDAAKPS